jgi:hypothetical protein
MEAMEKRFCMFGLWMRRWRWKRRRGTKSKKEMKKEKKKLRNN